ncbi:hypothetical protein [Hyphomicrobium sp. MC1]|uniref:hypothetical protein n=2 Tax=unclassified Hyphomicrobium TaxID=2619925 RepID=UPI000213D855|nr:hypothetical protein [Hyphomicrobium sp. MC1]CCB65700.1 conserved protein of unknown function [Hyphomicrobium sp. MC1]
MASSETSENVRSASHDLTDKAVDAGMRAMDSLERTAANLQDTGERLASKGVELGDGMQKVAKNFSNAVDKSVAEQPLTTLGMAVAAGFILGAIWKA